MARYGHLIAGAGGLLALWLLALNAAAADKPVYRTDVSGDEKTPWFQLVDGEFPPAGAGHHIAGELSTYNQLDRAFVLRADRTDTQPRSHWDLPLAATMLPYGSVHYHGAFAALEDIPMGTHLHGQFFQKNPKDKSKPIEAYFGRVTPEADFTRCILLEDDFSYQKRLGHTWRIESVDLEGMKLTAQLLESGKESGKPKQFDLLEYTRVWRARGFESLASLMQGQFIRFNLTWATLYGPGRLLEIWLDEGSQSLASAHQLKVHQRHVRERGLPGWVTAVDNEKQLVKVTLFSNFDPALLEPLHVTEEIGEEKERHVVSMVVALDSLATFDMVNDRQRGPLKSINKVPTHPGAVGMELEIRPNLMLEGFRPGKVVRVFAHGWPILTLPNEQRWEGRENNAPIFGR